MMYDPNYMTFGTSKTIEIENKSLIAREWNNRGSECEGLKRTFLAYESILHHDCGCNMTAFFVKMYFLK